ncbi:IS1380 family transposase [Singulisphaera acidiphila]|uniref:Transposase family protein n=16 Tax=Singulisphaera acidiphila TaxID=466153 RepID=H1MQB9_SINAD|nr:IS1380 family transposase [Singulisphaera acidiphila]AGA25597.1 transposase family protein [Singulisphaera acidiphila DSM 18658]AGA25844.1 transposase family protein [Singulisphaera acidiphila DSM 18658]AGA26516.1 transposase family protein [Singulisphaera acidiphila DSM 18658]AGA28061.1 transposase family protein [Singulisphaera acidiphila DSM 18658]AGA28196.1 transposase family protein [Singulisphaera acidiphila DSM 18658]
MATECNSTYLDFSILGHRQVLADFDGGAISSDGGALLLRQIEARTGIIRQFAACFTDHRDPDLVEHPLEHLLAQRVYGLALGYEDLNDHDDLRCDPLLATVVGKTDPTGQDRPRLRDRGKPLAGKSTLNRLELTPVGADGQSRYKKITCQTHEVERLFVTLFLQAHSRPPERIVLDLDATDDTVHGRQLGRFFHGYYKGYCYLPLYIFCGDHLLCARLRPSDIDASAGSVKSLKRIVSQIRQAWPQVKILIRADSGFCREEILRWCEDNGVDYLIGLAKNTRLTAAIATELAQARQQFEATKQPSRVFAELRYQTQKTWSRERRVVAKAEHLGKGANPRFVVTSLTVEERAAPPLYEQDYCGRGEMENRIKEQQLHLFADRTSAHTMRANQIRLFFSSIAYVLLEALRRLGLAGTAMAEAQCQTIRLKLLKIGALVRVTVRKVWVKFSSGCPYAEVFRRVHTNLARSGPLIPRC